jgi:hypothetical protein
MALWQLKNMYPVIQPIKFLLFISLILFLLINSPFAKELQNNKRIKSKTNSYDNKSFNLSSEKLPENYLGHDIKRVFATLSKRLTTKGEFETTEEYQTRIKKELGETIYGLLTIDNIYAFKPMVGVDTNYDADKQILRATVKPEPIFNPENLRDERLTFTIRIDHQNKGVYVGQNPFGAKKEIVKLDLSTYSILPININEFSLDCRGLNFRLNMNSNKAKKSKDHVQVLYIGRLTSPFIKSESFFKDATFDFPMEGINAINYLFFELSEIWLFDEISGEILYKQKRSTLSDEKK